MARRKKSGGETVSLFPFLSILACVIGTLTLMITATAISQMGKEQSSDVVDRSEEYEEQAAQNKVDQAELERLKQLLAEADTLEQELQDALEQLKRLQVQEEKQNKEMTAGQNLSTKLLAEANRLRKRIDELNKDPADRKAEIEKLMAEIKKRKIPPKAAEVVIKPGGSGLNLAPFFVECTKNGLRLLDNKDQEFVRIQDLDKEQGTFHKLLDRMAAQKKGTVVLLLRPDAINTYNTARNVARSHYSKDGFCPIGKLPVSTQGKIDLSKFRK